MTKLVRIVGIVLGIFGLAAAATGGGSLYAFVPGAILLGLVALSFLIGQPDSAEDGEGVGPVGTFDGGGDGGFE